MIPPSQQLFQFDISKSSWSVVPTIGDTVTRPAEGASTLVEGGGSNGENLGYCMLLSSGVHYKIHESTSLMTRRYSQISLDTLIHILPPISQIKFRGSTFPLSFPSILAPFLSPIDHPILAPVALRIPRPPRLLLFIEPTDHSREFGQSVAVVRGVDN